MGGSAGGGSTSITPRSFQQEIPQISQGYGFQQKGLNQFEQANPVFGNAIQGALNYYNQLPGVLSPLQSLYGNINTTGNALQSTIAGSEKNFLNPIIASGGALTPSQERDVSQQTRQLASDYGTGRQLGTLGTELLNRTSAQQQRYGFATGQEAALQGLSGQDIAQRTGLASGIQGLQTGNLNQLLGAGQGTVNAFSALTNPILSYLSNLFGENLQAQIAQAQINQQGNIANQNKTSGLIGSGISSIGSIAGAAALSDERLKTNIRDTGIATREGVPLKTWEYKTRPGVTYLSPVAQDVEKTMPERVITDPRTGIKFISGFPMVEVKREEAA